MKKLTLMLENFENISEGQGKKLVGGFSASFSIDLSGEYAAAASNNCKGGNCAEGCAGNTGCNVVASCGVKFV